MLDPLPLELVQHIVFLTLPSSSSFTKYRERQDTLLALCLTSRALCAAAQPVLFESVNLESDKAVEAFLKVVEANKAMGERVRALRLASDLDEWHEAEPVDFGSFAASCPRIVDIMLFHQCLDVQSLEVLPRLVSLTVSHCSVEALTSFRIPRLEDLSLFCSRIHGVHVFSPESYPSLRAAHVQCYNCYDLDKESFKRLQPRCGVSCDMVDLEHGIVESTPSMQRGILHDCGLDVAVDVFNRTKTAHLRSMRLNPFAGESDLDDEHTVFSSVDQRSARILQGISDELKNPSALPALSTLYLPSTFGDCGIPVFDDDSSLFAQLKQLVASRNIELIFEDLPHPYYDSMISPEFVKRCKAAKARKGADEGAGE